MTLSALSRPPVAVIGMGCRFPGGSDTPDAYWRLLHRGEEGVIEVPGDRWDIDAFYDPDPKAVGKIYARSGGFLTEPVDRFDAGFFGMSPHEAWPLDPAQRLLLEVAWECLEYAGIPPHSVSGTDTGVFVGLSDSDYIHEQTRLGGDNDLSAYHATGVAASFGSGHLSHFLGAEGPSVSIDTACSSSLVAMLLARDALLEGRCRLALAGGSRLLLSAGSTIVLCRLGALSPSGVSRVFDARADGYVRAEGAGMIALKRLDHAREDGDRVLAIMRGGAWNHDGRSPSLTVPRGGAQEAVMRGGLRDAGLEAGDVGYVEAHGTGTPVGDPVEAIAIGNVYGADRGGRGPVVVGSCKTNLGHLEIAAGMAGLIKAILALQHREIPAHLHFEEPNPHVDWSRYALRIPTDTEPWHTGGAARVAAVSSFGLSGTNAHIILEEAARTEPAGPRPIRPIHVLTASGRTEGAVRDLVARYRGALPPDEEALADFCHTATAGRSHHRHRVAVVGRDHAELLAALDQRAAGPVPRVGGTSPPPIAFLFTGQGAQYPGMARGLFEAFPAFREVLERCDEVLRTCLDHSLLSVLYDDARGDLIHRTEYTQPALFSVEMGLVALWRSLGLEPTHVMGHSLGEYSAAATAGTMDLDEALRLVALRGRLMAELPEAGTMAVAFAEEAQVARASEGFGGTVSIAAINGPRNTVVSGRTDDVRSVLERLEAEGIRCRPLEVSHAFHSPLMEPMLEPFEDAVRAVTLARPRIPLVSNVTGRPMDPDVPADPTYWRSHVRSPVRFADSIRALHEAGVDGFIEVGPHPTLLGMAGLTLTDQRITAIPSLRRGQDDLDQFHRAVAAVYEIGRDLAWSGLDPHRTGRRITIPTYPFQRKRHWYSAGEGSGGQRSQTMTVRTADAVQHPLLGTRLRSPSISGVVYQALLDAKDPKYLGAYRIGRLVHAPVSALLEAVRAGVEHGLRWSSCALGSIVVGDPLALPPGESRFCQVVISEPAGGSSRFELVSTARSGSGTPRWTRHLSGRIEADDRGDGSCLDERTGTLDDARSRCSEALDPDAFYEGLGSNGVKLKRAFRPLREILRGSGEVLGRVALPDDMRHDSARYGVHPSLLDAVIQLPAALSAVADRSSDALLPVGTDRVVFAAEAGELAWVHVRPSEASEPTRSVDATLAVDATGFDAAGRPTLLVEGLRLRPRAATSAGRIISEDEWSYEIEWRASEPPTANLADQHWLVVGDADSVEHAVALELEKAGAIVHRCTTAEGRGDDETTIHRADPTRTGWAREVFERLSEAGVDEVRGVVAVLGLGPVPVPDGAAELLDRSVGLCSSAVAVTLAASRAPGFAGRVHFVTRGAADVDDGSVPAGLPGATLWGLLPMLRSEYPDAVGSVVDLDPSGDLDATPLPSELGATDGEDRVAYRSRRRRVPRLVRFQESGPIRESRLRDDRAYLVTGGMGGVGRAVAHWLADHGVGALVLNGRRAPDDEAMAWIGALRRAGTRVDVVPGDVSVPDDVDRIFARLSDLGLPLGGVFHTAGVLDDGPLAETTPASFHKVMAPKVAGAWNLHRRTLEMDIDHFVLFSSAAAFMATALQGNYAASNAFLGALAAYRRRSGLPALCVDWGPWAGRGMAARLSGRDRTVIERYGIQFLDGPRALGLLGHHIRESSTRVAIMAMEWSRYSDASGVARVPPFLSALADGRLDESDDGEGTQSLRTTLAALPEDQRADTITTLVTAHVADVLGMPPEQLPPDVDARESGLDSLMALEVRHRVEADLGVVIPTGALIDGLSPLRLATVLTQLVASESAPVPATPEAPWIEGEI